MLPDMGKLILKFRQHSAATNLITPVSTELITQHNRFVRGMTKAGQKISTNVCVGVYCTDVCPRRTKHNCILFEFMAELFLPK